MSTKKESMKSSFIREGNIFSVIFKIALPLMINNIIITIYNLADGLYLAQLSHEDFAATGFIWPILFLFTAVGIGVSIAGTSILSQLIGAGRRERLKQYATHIVLLSLGLGLIFAVLGVLTAKPILMWMGASGSFLEKSLVYLRINYIGLFFDLGFFAYQSILNAQGDTKTSTIISGSAAILNILVDPFLIFTGFNILGIAFPGLGLGVVGAAIATVLSKIVSFAAGVVAVKRKSEEIEFNMRNHKNDSTIYKNLMKMALPTSISQSGTALGFIVLNRFVQSYGTDTLAAYSMVNRVSDFLSQPAMGIGAALTTVIGQNFGANLIKRTREVYRKGMTVTLIFSAVGAFIIYYFNEQLIGIFITEDSSLQMIQDATTYMYYSAVIVFFMGMYSVNQGYYQGTGYMNYSLVLSMSRLWIVRIPVLYLLKWFTNMNQDGIWLAMLISNAASAIIGHILYKARNKKPDILLREKEEKQKIRN